MQEYIEQITRTANKLNSVGFPITDFWLGAIMLTGLFDEFKPVIMSYEGSDKSVEADAIKMKLLETQYNKGDKKKNHGRMKWHTCGRSNHKSTNCWKNENSSSSSKSNAKDTKNENAKQAFRAFHSSKLIESNKSDWLDSGASNHMTLYSEIISDKQISCTGDIITANNSKMSVEGSGKLDLQLN